MALLMFGVGLYHYRDIVEVPQHISPLSEKIDLPVKKYTNDGSSYMVVTFVFDYENFMMKRNNGSQRIITFQIRKKINERKHD